jgi:hypothetical protein
LQHEQLTFLRNLIFSLEINFPDCSSPLGFAKAKSKEILKNTYLGWAVHLEDAHVLPEERLGIRRWMGQVLVNGLTNGLTQRKGGTKFRVNLPILTSHSARCGILLVLVVVDLA